LDQLAGVPLPGVDAAGSVFLSPDGEWVGYHDVREARFKKVRLTAVSLQRSAPLLAPHPASAAPRGAERHHRLLRGGVRGAHAGIGCGGIPQPLTKPAEGEIHMNPSFLPGGRALLFVISSAGKQFHSGEDDTVAVLPFDTPQARALAAGIGPRFSASGHIVFLRLGGLWAIKFDPVRLEVKVTRPRCLKGATRFRYCGNGTLRLQDAGVAAPRTSRRTGSNLIRPEPAKAKEHDMALAEKTAVRFRPRVRAACACRWKHRHGVVFA